MRTPCQSDPEMWVADNAEARREAVKGCAPCHRKTDCLTEALESGVTSGVWGGHDFSTRRSPGQAKTCQVCKATFGRREKETSGAWLTRKFCGRACAGISRRSAGSSVGVSKPCGFCGEAFSRPNLSAAQWQAQRFCSARCGRKASAGRAAA